MGRNVKSSATVGAVELNGLAVSVNQFLMSIGWFSGVVALLKFPRNTPEKKNGAKSPVALLISAFPKPDGQGEEVSTRLQLYSMPVVVTLAVLPPISKVPTMAADNMLEVASGSINASLALRKAILFLLLPGFYKSTRGASSNQVNTRVSKYSFCPQNH
jgi:hypothetical protein